MGPAAGDEAFVSLYRRFRPGRFVELMGQPHVVAGLQHAVRDDRVAHAYLFSGPRGTGKTSAARILARALNCEAPKDGEPCGTCDSCVEIARGASLDVHELDAASNNGVDAMRDLVGHAALATPGRWKVYIVDEVHMLSNAAANALLKTLEEPPSHVVFVLATTDPQKVPATIRSRTQHYEFRLFGFDTLVELLRTVRDSAQLDLDEDVLALAARRGRGSARDALSALDQLAASGTVDDDRPGVAAVLDALCEEDAQAILVAATALHEAGWAGRPPPPAGLPPGGRPRTGRGRRRGATPAARPGVPPGPAQAGPGHGTPGARPGRHARGPRCPRGPRGDARPGGQGRPRLVDRGAGRTSDPARAGHGPRGTPERGRTEASRRGSPASEPGGPADARSGAQGAAGRGA
jgi:DNA polymerase III subunit gamma/tau